MLSYEYVETNVDLLNGIVQYCMSATFVPCERCKEFLSAHI